MIALSVNLDGSAKTEHWQTEALRLLAKGHDLWVGEDSPQGDPDTNDSETTLVKQPRDLAALPVPPPNRSTHTPPPRTPQPPSADARQQPPSASLNLARDE